MKNLLVILFALGAFSVEASIDSLFEIETLVAKLNNLSGNNVKIKQTEKCGFRLDGLRSAGEEAVINFCASDIEPFESEPHLYSLHELHTIVAHEYAHAIVDYGNDSHIETEEQHDLAVSFITNQLMTNELWNNVIKALLTMKEPGDSDENHIEWLVSNDLNLAHHENIDTLGVKLLFLIGYKPTASLFASLKVSSDWEKKTLVVRASHVEQAISEGLNKWDTYNCTEISTDRESYPHLRAFLESSGLRLLSDVTSKCSKEEVFRSLVKTMRRYHFL